MVMNLITGIVGLAIMMACVASVALFLNTVFDDEVGYDKD